MSRPRLAANVAVCVPSGRWGRRRVRVSECEHVICAERVYSLIVSDTSRPLPAFDARVTIRLTVDGRHLELFAVRRPNTIWRCGRVFLICPICRMRRTRLYLPRAGHPESPTVVVGCRTCLGLTYASRSLRNYRNVLRRRGIGSILGWSYRDDALIEAGRVSRERRAAARARWAERRPFLVVRASEQGGAHDAEA